MSKLGPLEELDDLILLLRRMEGWWFPYSIHTKIRRIRFWMGKCRSSTCGGGIVGCRGGPNCTSDHK